MCIHPGGPQLPHSRIDNRVAGPTAAPGFKVRAGLRSGTPGKYSKGGPSRPFSDGRLGEHHGLCEVAPGKLFAELFSRGLGQSVPDKAGGEFAEVQVRREATGTFYCGLIAGGAIMLHLVYELVETAERSRFSRFPFVVKPACPVGMRG